MTRGLLKTGFALLIIAFVLIGISYSVLRANSVRSPELREGRMLVTEQRKLGAAIRSLDVSGPVTVTLRQGSTPGLTIKCEQRLLENIDTTTFGTNLHLGVRGMLLHHRQPIRIEVVLPSLENLNLNGSGSVTANGFSGERIGVQLNGTGNLKFNGRYKEVAVSLQGSGDLDYSSGVLADHVVVDMTGPGTLTLAGMSQSLRVQQTGSGTVRARHLEAEEVTAEQGGSGQTSVHANRVITLTQHGSGSIDVWGEPRTRTINRTGNGDIEFHR